MDKGSYYKIQVEGVLKESWSDWFEGLEIHDNPGGGTTLSGWLIDQAALFSVLMKINNLNLTLISVARVPPG